MFSKIAIIYYISLYNKKILFSVERKVQNSDSNTFINLVISNYSTFYIRQDMLYLEIYKQMYPLFIYSCISKTKPKRSSIIEKQLII